MTSAKRHTHPATPWVTVLRVLPGFVVLFVVLRLDQGTEALTEALPISPIAGMVLGVLVIGGFIVGASYVSWRRLEFWFDESGDLRVSSGVLTRNERRLQLSRLQSVDVEQPLVARIVGLAELRVEVAGSGDSRVTLQYLSESDAHALREEVLARAAGLRPDTGQAPERPLIRVATRDLAVSLMLSSVMVFAVVATVVIVVIAVFVSGVTGLFALVLVGGAPLVAVLSEFLRYFDFTVAESPDGLRLRSGLTTKQSQTVPPGRVHAVELAQPFLWRRRGWVRVRITVAGAPGQGEQLSTGVLLPVAPEPVARAIVDRALAGLALDRLEWNPVPERTKWRAPWQWRRLAIASDGVVVAARAGRFVRTVAVVPHARVQSVSLLQGPWQRRLNLASVRLDIAPGPILAVAHHLDAATARQFVDVEAVTAREARLQAPPDRWMSHTGQAIEPEAPSAGSEPETPNQDPTERGQAG